MENHAPYPRIVLRVDMDCRKKCPKRIKKAFMDINGVDSVMVDPEEEMLVYVTGKVDPKLLLKAAEKMGKTAEILYYEKEPCRINSGQRRKDKGESSCGREMEEDGFVHKVEDYVPPEFDERLCRDPYCQLHRNRPFISQHVPPRHSGHTAGGGNSFCDCYRQPHRPRMPRHGYGSYGDRYNGCRIM